MPNFQATFRTFNVQLVVEQLQKALLEESFLRCHIHIAKNLNDSEWQTLLQTLEPIVQQSKMLSIATLNIGERTHSQRKKKWRLVHNTKRRSLWAQYCLVLAFVRANIGSKLKFSILTLAPHIWDALGCYDPNASRILGKLVETQHAQSHFVSLKKRKKV